MSIIPVSVKTYVASKSAQATNYEQLVSEKVVVNGKQITRFYLTDHPKLAFVQTTVLSLFSADPSIKSGTQAFQNYQLAIAKRAAAVQKLRKAVRSVINLQIGNGLNLIRSKGYQGLIMDDPYWTEAIDPQHFGPDLRGPLFIKWQRAKTNSTYSDWLITDEGKKAQENAIDTLRSRHELRKEELEMHPVSRRMVHKIDLQKIQVKYLTEAERAEYEVEIRMVGGKAKLFSKRTQKPILNETYIFVIGPDEKIYAHKHVINQFHHSSFLSGQAVIGAGEFITDAEGNLTLVTSKSGHYKPERTHMREVLSILFKNGTDLRTFDIKMMLGPDIPEERHNANDFFNMTQTTHISFETKKL